MVQTRISNLNNLGFGQMSLVVVLAVALSLLGISISHVFGSISQEKMAFLDARADVAVVANEFSAWDLTMDTFPCVSMRENLSSIATDDTVAFRANSSSPQSAAFWIRTCDIGQKTIIERATTPTPVRTTFGAVRLLRILRLELIGTETASRSMLSFSHDDLPCRCGQDSCAVGPALESDLISGLFAEGHNA